VQTWQRLTPDGFMIYKNNNNNNKNYNNNNIFIFIFIQYHINYL